MRHTRALPLLAGLLAGLLAALPAATAQAQARPSIAQLQAQIEALQSQVATGTIPGVSGYVTMDTSIPSRPRLLVSGANLQVVNGSGATDSTNGLGNVIVGYDEPVTFGVSTCSRGEFLSATLCALNAGTWALSHKSGSHNVVIGKEHNYSRYGGLVAGYRNTISGIAASVLGGTENSASRGFSVVSGGALNLATNDFASVSGGFSNTAAGIYSNVTGGMDNAATQSNASVTGGASNRAFGINSTVSGGLSRIANGTGDWVAGSLTQDQ